MHSVLSLAAVASWASIAAAALQQLPLAPAAALVAGVSSGNGTFEQLIDHDHPELGTFSQRYWWSDEYWKGPGSPIILFQPGESNADGFQGYLSNRTVTGLYAQELGGAGLILEHRYYGDSSPVDELTPKTMQHLTFKNALADAVYFAKNVELPFDSSTMSSPDNAAWILVGGSYSGAQAGWTAATMPGTFWAYHASSAPVEAIWNYWQYFVPIRERLPQNCTTDLVNVIKHIDKILTGSDENAKQTLKDKFQLGDLRDDDFASALVYGPDLGQTTSASDSYGLYDFCNYIENVYADSPASPDANGVGVAKALDGYAQWWSTFSYGYCARYGYWTSNTTTECFDTYNSSNPLYADNSVGNAANKQWQWLCCNEPFGAWQDGAPNGTQSIVSRLVTDDYFLRTCGTFFQPDDGYTYASAQGKRSSAVNAWTQGWQGTTERVIWAQGQYDPWREETVSSDFRPGGPLDSTDSNPIFIMKDASHCYDLILRNADENESVKEVVDAEVKQMKAWVAEFQPKNNNGTSLHRKLRN